MRFFCVLAAAFLAACSSDGGDGTGGTADGSSGELPDVSGDEEPAELEGILAAHNEARQAEGVPPLIWDSNLQAIAEEWAASCTDSDGDGLIDHNDDRNDSYPTYVGENIFGASQETSGADAVASWVQEGQNYDHASCTCTGGVCGHYTQVMWADSERLGCAKANCPGTFGHAIVCNYAPGGNVGGDCPF